MSEIVKRSVIVPLEAAGRRLDQVLAELLPEFSRSRLKEWIEAERVLVDGRALRPRNRMAGGESIVVDVVLEARAEAVAEPIELRVVYEDPYLLVVDKPAGLVVHPGAGNPRGTLQNALLHRDRALERLPRAGIVHRLDKDTSGLLVVARSVEAHTALVRQLEARKIEREYEAICVGVMTAGGTVDAPISRHPLDRLRMTVRADGRAAVTHYRVLARFRAHTHVRVHLETGRTHQIRVHLAHIGHPLVGDRSYGGRLSLPKNATPALVEALRGFRRQALHASRLAFDHPLSGVRIECEAPRPADFEHLLIALAEDYRAARGRP